MLTILLPTYNGAKYIDECLLSILSQDYKDFELLIIDDHSSDETTRIINSYHDNRIRLICNAVNTGLANSLNFGISKSSFNLIVRIDQDDVMHPERLSNIVKAFQRNSSSSIFFSESDVIDSSGSKLGRFKVSSNTRKINFILIFINPFIHSSAAFVKSNFSNPSIYDSSSNYSPPEDFELWSRSILLDKKKFHVINKPLIKYRFTDDSYSRKSIKLAENASNICFRNINEIMGSKVNKHLALIISGRLYVEKFKSKINYIYLLKFLFSINKSVNRNFKISDIVFIAEIFVRITLNFKLKILLNQVINLKNLFRYR